MLGYLKAILDAVIKRLEPYLGGLFRVLGRVKWFTVAIVTALLNAVVFAVKFFVWSTAYFATTTGSLVGKASALVSGGGGAGGWAALANGAALMNCVVPLDYALSAAGVLLGTFVLIQAWRGVVFVYRLIPLKFT